LNENKGRTLDAMTIFLSLQHPEIVRVVSAVLIGCGVLVHR
jgi:hypothetical protein